MRRKHESDVDLEEMAVETASHPKGGYFVVVQIKFCGINKSEHRKQRDSVAEESKEETK
jgi:hypothetical protein